MKQLVRELFVFCLSASLVVGCFSSGSTNTDERARNSADAPHAAARSGSAEAIANEVDDNAVGPLPRGDEHEDQFVKVNCNFERSPLANSRF